VSGTFKVSLKPNERIYVNGAVLRFDRRTSLEFLNDVHFLLESHVLQLAHADTPLKRLYFVIQTQIMAPQDVVETMPVFERHVADLLSAFKDPRVVNELKHIDRMVRETRYHEAMKTLRGLYPIEQRLFEEYKTSFPFEEMKMARAANG